MEKRPILISVAMQSELSSLVNKLDNKKERKILNYRAYEGFINSYPVVILETQVGLVNAAISLTKAVDIYKPVAIINQGTAGSHEYNVRKFDIVIGKTVVNINSIKTNVMQLGRGINPLDWQIKEFISDAKDEVIVYEASEEMVELAEKISDKYTYGKLHTLRIGSGDVWNREIDRIKWINKTLKTSCEEMESMSVYKIANMNNIPVLAIKVISNNEILGEKFDVLTAEACQEFVYEYIKEYIKLLKENKGSK